MAQGGNTIGFGSKGSLDYPSGVGQGGGGARKTTGRNLCFNPSMGSGPDGYYPAVSTGTVYPKSIRLDAVRPTGLTPEDTALLGQTCLLVGGIRYSQYLRYTFETLDPGGWVNVSNASSVQAVGTAPYAGIYHLSVVAAAAGDVVVGGCALTANSVGPASFGFKVWEGRSYTATMRVRTAVTSRQVAVGIGFYTSAFTLIGSITYGTAVTDTTSYQLASTVQNAPAGAHFAVLYYRVTAAGGAGEAHYLDDVIFYDTVAQANAISGTSQVLRYGAMDDTEDSYALYEFWAQPNTTYTFSGYMRHAPDYLFTIRPENSMPNVDTFNDYALRLHDPNDAVDFGDGTTVDPTISQGTVLTGKETYGWVRHAFTYTTGSVVTKPLQLRLYGNKVWETNTETTSDTTRHDSGFPYTMGQPNYDGLTTIPLLSQLNVGSYWDAIQIEESAAPSSYIDGTQRNCDWRYPSDNFRQLKLALGNIDQSNNIPINSLANWSSSTGGTLGVIDLDPNGTNDLVNRWFSKQDNQLVTGILGPLATDSVAGRYAIQFSTTAAARARSALQFAFYGGNSGNNGFYQVYDTQRTDAAGKVGTISFYARSISGDPGLTVALENTDGTHRIISQDYQLTTSWRRYLLRWSDSAPTEEFNHPSSDPAATPQLTFLQASPSLAAVFQIAGVLSDVTVVNADGVALDPTGQTGDLLPGYEALYMPGWPVEHQAWSGNSLPAPGEGQKNQFETYAYVSHLAVRTEDLTHDESVGIPSFAGIIEAATINLSVLNRCMLIGIAGREWRDIRFANDLYNGKSAGTQAITLYGDPNVVNGSYGIGVQQLEAYVRVPTNAKFSVRSGGVHWAPGTATAGTEILEATAGGLNVVKTPASQATVPTSQTTTSGSYTDLATVGPQLTCICPPSGLMLVVADAWMMSGTTGARAGAAYDIETRSTPGTGAWSSVLAADDTSGFGVVTVTGGAIMQAAKAKVWAGTPGSEYRFTMRYKSNGAATATFKDRSLGVIPLMS